MPQGSQSSSHHGARAAALGGGCCGRLLGGLGCVLSRIARRLCRDLCLVRLAELAAKARQLLLCVLCGLAGRLARGGRSGLCLLLGCLPGALLGLLGAVSRLFELTSRGLPLLLCVLRLLLHALQGRAVLRLLLLLHLFHCGRSSRGAAPRGRRLEGPQLRFERLPLGFLLFELGQRRLRLALAGLHLLAELRHSRGRSATGGCGSRPCAVIVSRHGVAADALGRAHGHLGSAVVLAAPHVEGELLLPQVLEQLVGDDVAEGAAVVEPRVHRLAVDGWRAALPLVEEEPEPHVRAH
mmetsp:Transcript_17047/g.64541  ORF Transcript_17047/g.64541 Transcript_17047/m.64541 type:complete len:296 (+) Transcript_17047:1438-2325(+)